MRPPSERQVWKPATRVADVVLLDWQMPELTGWEVAQRLATAQAPAVIFVTAFSEHAHRAAEQSIDYLLKPVDVASRTAALARARRTVRRRAADLASAPP